jgi:hypothetical protein
VASFLCSFIISLQQVITSYKNGSLQTVKVLKKFFTNITVNKIQLIVKNSDGCEDAGHILSQFRLANTVHTSHIKLVYYYTSPCARHWRRNNNLQRLICMLVSTITLCARTAYFVCGVMNKGHLIKIMALLNVIQISRQRQIAPHFAAPHCVKGKNDRTLFGRCDSINKFHLGARAGARIVSPRGGRN